jgi:hypothetical protein
MAETLTLSDFLVARIAEQETDYRKALGYCLSVDDHRTAKLLGLALRDCEAKRRIVVGHADWHVCPNLANEGYTDYGDGSGDEWEDICPTLRALAAVHADHAHFRQEWAGE